MGVTDELIDTPGASSESRAAELEKDATVSLAGLVAPTLIADDTQAGDMMPVFVPELPEATTTAMPWFFSCVIAVAIAVPSQALAVGVPPPKLMLTAAIE